MKLDPNSELYRMRHSAAHVMATAVCRLYDDVQLDIGPPTDEGFYYDFDLPHRLTPEDFERIEEEMRNIVKEDQPFECMECSREEALERIKASGQEYKVGRLGDIPEGEAITFYKNGEFVDLCRGPHVETTKDIKAFKILSVAGSYFRGKETNPMMQRLYATAFKSDKELRTHVRQLEEAKKRDHRKIGKELKLFSIEENTGPGLVHWHPRGARIRSIVEDFWKKQHFDSDYEMLYSPHIGRGNLWETSGHLDFYREGMYAPMDIDGNEYFIKPMNCPFHINIYKSDKHSYRDLPLRWAELGTVYRFEKTGVLHGLLRVRGFTQDDAHIFCTPDQIEDEVREVIRFSAEMWRAFGFDNITAYLATRPEKAVGEQERWDQATKSLELALQAEGIKYEVDPGGGAFYGPKIDMKIKDAIGREWQMSTIQFDFNLPDRFDLTFVGEDGKEHRPYMVHRALLGSIERFFGILVEHYAGAFPLWLAAEQLRILPLTENEMENADTVCAELKARGFRVSVDQRSERMGNKIRKAQVEKIPYMLVLGPKEIESNTIAVRSRTEGDLGSFSMDEIAAALNQEVETHGRTLAHNVLPTPAGA